jgi:prepilin-type N-terminal cleavage/methylation domain-containing protein
MKLFSITNKKICKSESQQGFTLVETLVAVAIFSISIAAVISVTAQGIASTSSSKNRIVANYLAQENIEYMRHLRNKYTPTPGGTASWNSFMDLAARCVNKCAMADPTEFDPADELIPCLDSDKCEDRPVMYADNSLDGTGYFYQTATPSPNTPYRRYIVVENIGVDEIKVISTVVWEERNNAQKNITLTETLTNWLPTGN